MPLAFFRFFFYFSA
ncbi:MULTISPECIES: pheST operon leader peptide PheM [Photorhabdus]|nr:pheST operon leader peptide PheM [Photorhabdus thracensis]MCT8347655.1 pheST operon leader peptide PheM [Photorhabdus temperata]